MRVLIVNQHTHNLGDEAAGVALVQMLLSSDGVELVDIVYNGVGYIPFSDPRVRRAQGVELKDIGALTLALYLTLRWRGVGPGSGALQRYRDLVRSADIVLIAPSGANIGIYRDWRFLVRVLLVVRQGIHPVFHWNTIGRSGNWLFDYVARYVLLRSRLFVREQASRVYLEQLGISCVTGPDTAFALASCAVPVRADVLSLVLSELDSWHPEFRGEGANGLVLGPIISSVAAFALRHGLRVEILPHVKNDGERAFNLAARESLLSLGMVPDSVTICDVPSFQDYDQALASSRLVVGGRYHSVVLASKNYRPFVALAYENKMLEVCGYLGMEDFCVDLHNASTAGEEVARALERVWCEEVALSESLRWVVSERLRATVCRPLRASGVPVRLPQP